ncbi:MAG: hypothetical protein HY902_13410 [Deltaproteobacteria bacterium]|nr:hypothetical protein [Deltaproteobacteria bacterium]
MRQLQLAAWLALVAVSGPACSSAYTPRRSAALKLLMENGQPTLLKNGSYTPMGMFGGGLVEAVAEHPQALEYAEAYRDGTVWGFGTAIAGAVVMGLSPLALAADGNANNRGPSDQAVNTTLAVAGVGLIAYCVGLAMVVDAQPHMFDAINRYNDAVEEGWRPPAAPTPIAE